MSISRESVVEMVFGVIDKFNKQLIGGKKLDKSLNAKLYGENGTLDSLELVDFIVEVEQKIQDVFKVSVSVADEKAISQVNSPFRTVDTLTDYITQLLTTN